MGGGHQVLHGGADRTLNGGHGQIRRCADQTPGRLPGCAARAKGLHICPVKLLSERELQPAIAVVAGHNDDTRWTPSDSRS
jgi:hypothetical protein